MSDNVKETLLAAVAIACLIAWFMVTLRYV